MTDQSFFTAISIQEADLNADVHLFSAKRSCAPAFEWKPDRHAGTEFSSFLCKSCLNEEFCDTLSCFFRESGLQSDAAVDSRMQFFSGVDVITGHHYLSHPSYYSTVSTRCSRIYWQKWNAMSMIRTKNHCVFVAFYIFFYVFCLSTEAQKGQSKHLATEPEISETRTIKLNARYH